MKIVAIVGAKGGTGKTMLTQNLFVDAGLRGLSAAIVDMDPEAVAQEWSDRRKLVELVRSTYVTRLGKQLQEFRGAGVEFCILDTAAGAPLASLEAAKVADLVLAPVRPFISDMGTLKSVRDLLTLAGEPKALVVMNAAPVSGERDKDAARATKALGLEVCPVVLHNRIAFADAPAFGLGINEFQPKSTAAQEFLTFSKYVFKLLNLRTSKPRQSP